MMHKIFTNNKCWQQNNNSNKLYNNRTIISICEATTFAFAPWSWYHRVEFSSISLVKLINSCTKRYKKRHWMNLSDQSCTKEQRKCFRVSFSFNCKNSFLSGSFLFYCHRSIGFLMIRFIQRGSQLYESSYTRPYFDSWIHESVQSVNLYLNPYFDYNLWSMNLGQNPWIFARIYESVPESVFWL